ncbi:MAG: caspase family protein, partial [Bacteroidota bacterium]|nr:caspase family protein [Bacteroidota bacterium]
MAKINSKDTKAILIGVSEFQDKANFVNAAPIKNNVPKIKELLRDPVILGLPDENILVFTENEKHDEILKGIKTFLSESVDTIIFYFAGHGYKTKNGDFYMVTNNSYADWIASTAIPWKTIKNMLQQGSGIQQRFYILDACHSGAATLSADENMLEIPKGSAIIAAASEDEKAYFNKKN